MKIGVLGYASVGKNLEVLFKNAGYTTIIGVRSPEKYEQDDVTDIVAAAEDADTVVLAIPYRVCSEVLPDLKCTFHLAFILTKFTYYGICFRVKWGMKKFHLNPCGIYEKTLWLFSLNYFNFLDFLN